MDKSVKQADLDLSIIIISYNTRKMTCECLKTVFEQTHKFSYEVVVVDNASEDGSPDAIADEFNQVRLFKCKDNHGFAAANNMAVSQSKGKWILLLNPDTLVLDRAIDKLLEFAKNNKSASIFGGRTLFADGTLNPTSCWGKPTLLSSFYRGLGVSALFKGSSIFDPESIGEWSRDSVREVDIITGCFFLLKRRTWDTLEGFDPLFFMYAEETDLCLRAQNQGLKCLINPNAEIVHYGGASESVYTDKMLRLFRAKAQLFSRHWSPTRAYLGILTLDLWALTRVIGYTFKSLFTNSCNENSSAWWSIWKQRSSWHKKAIDETKKYSLKSRRVITVCPEI